MEEKAKRALDKTTEPPRVSTAASALRFPPLANSRIPRPDVQMSHLEGQRYTRIEKGNYYDLLLLLTSRTRLDTCSWRHTTGTRHLAWRRTRERGANKRERLKSWAEHLQGAEIEGWKGLLRGYLYKITESRREREGERRPCKKNEVKLHAAHDKGEGGHTWENGTRTFLGVGVFYIWNFLGCLSGGSSPGSDSACLAPIGHERLIVCQRFGVIARHNAV